MTSELQEAFTRARKKKNAEFQLVWCETNLRYLVGEPPSEKRNKNIEYMKSEIERLRKKLLTMPNFFGHLPSYRYPSVNQS